MNKSIAVVLGSLVAAISLTAIVVKATAKSEPTWQFVPGSVTNGDTFKAVRNGLIKKEKTISVCGVKSPDINQPSGIESQEVLAKILKESGELEIKIKQFVNKDRFGKERDTLAGEVYLIKENGDKVSLARELLKSGKVEPINMRTSVVGDLGTYGTCFVNQDEFEFFARQAVLRKKAREQELIEETKETKEEKTIEISESEYWQMVETIEKLQIQRDKLARQHYGFDY